MNSSPQLVPSLISADRSVNVDIKSKNKSKSKSKSKRKSKSKSKSTRKSKSKSIPPLKGRRFLGLVGRVAFRILTFGSLKTFGG